MSSPNLSPKAAANKKKSVSGKWVANVSSEAGRLAKKETDWNIATATLERRTRGKKIQLPLGGDGLNPNPPETGPG